VHPIAIDLPARGFDHPALLYRGRDEYLAGTLPFIEAALAAGEPVMVAVPADNLTAIRDGLGDAATEITMHDMGVAGRNPGRIIPGVLLRFAHSHAGKPVRIIGEPIWPGRDALEYPACVQHEALINSAFAGREATVLCPYDAARLDGRAIEDAHRTHPVMATARDRWVSPTYADPFVVAADFNVPLPDPPERAVRFPLGAPGLGTLRRVVTEYGRSASLAPDRVADLTLAVNELASNTMTHGGGAGTLSLWIEDGTVVCQVHDGGYIANPMAGRIAPGVDGPPGGRGLLLVHQLCDLVRVHTRPGATTVRVHVYR
jgi:anti-sigma regulatory factor (Ser/Thr protein kinase)